jgi:putative PIN family toxin of toxin-antitoxin system
MRVVFDTNTFVSHTLNLHGASAQLVNVWKDGIFDLVVSPPILEEYAKALFLPNLRAASHLSDAEVRELLISLERFAVTTPGAVTLEIVPSDPDDEKFLVAAVEGGAAYLISQDRHLRKFKEYLGITILLPSRFLKVLKKQKSL